MRERERVEIDIEIEIEERVAWKRCGWVMSCDRWVARFGSAIWY